MARIEGPASIGQYPALLLLLIWPYAAAGSGKQLSCSWSLLHRVAPRAATASGLGERCQLLCYSMAQHTCDHLLGIIGLHVPIILPQALGIPLPFGPFGIVRVCIILQDDDLSREQALLASGGSSRGGRHATSTEPGREEAHWGPQGRMAFFLR